MIAFLLGLLKVIGIILLVVLILLLVIVGVVLFVPIRYQGKGQITDDKKEASVKITWLLKALQCGVDYTFPKQPVIGIKVLGIDVMKLLEKCNSKTAKAAETKKKKTSKKPVPGVNTSLIEPDVDTNSSATADRTQDDAFKSTTESSQDAASKTTTESQQDATSKVNTTTNKETGSPRQEKSADEPKIPLKKKIQTIIDKVKNIIYNIKYYVAVLQEEDTKQLIVNAWKAIVKILKSIRPQVFKLKGEFGFDAPDTTGKVYGMYAVVMPMVGEYIVLEPNFEEQVIRGEVELKGRITTFVIVVNALKIVFDKRLQTLIKKLKHGGKKDGRK